MPVPKVHLNTNISVTIKNQWGIIQDPSLRLKLHPHFKEVVYQVNKAIPPSIAIVDGRYGLNRSGPLKGDVVDLNWILMSNSIFHADFVVAELMGMDLKKIPYLKYIFEKEKIDSIVDIEFNTDYKKFKSTQFYLKRKWTDYPGYLAFHSSLLSYLAYQSPLAGLLHKLLYIFRDRFYNYEEPEKTVSTDY